MITMINERNGHKTTFKNYQKLYSHIDSRQRSKRYYMPNQLIDDWFFAYHSHRRIMALYEFVSIQKRNTEKKTGGKMPKVDVLEMSHDRSKKPVIISITPDIQIESFLEDWCRRWCVFHGYKLVEIQDDDGILHVKKAQNHSSYDEQDLRAIE
jgi:hypothetical protein